MKESITVPELISLLRSENIKTWFDLGMFIDRIRENRPHKEALFSGPFHAFEKEVDGRSIAFLTFQYSVDGVTVEVNKYATLFNRNFPGAAIHYIAGIFRPEAEKHFPGSIKRFEMPEIAGFDSWRLYKDFFFSQLERGGEVYNRLILDFWEDTLDIVEKLGRYLSGHQISILYLVNVCSNPGNVSLCLACVLLSEYLGIPVINNNHDFYWEGGNSASEIANRGLKEGPRDFFFTNAHLGEVFSIIEVLYPWESRYWINVNINEGQSDHLVKIKGHNPANVTEIGTAVDTEAYMKIDKRKRIRTFLQFEKILSRYQDRLIAYSACDVIDNGLLEGNEPSPILIGSKTRAIDGFISENIIFLQPTRIISRKRIEAGFRLLIKLLENKDFKSRLSRTPGLKFTILVTGPVAEGHREYLNHLLLSFDDLLSEADASIRERLFLAFLFSELDKEAFKNCFEDPVGMPELYNISSLILLPSKTEGRGLPIIEAAASGIPIFCRRYFPKNVYFRVIGKHLDESDRFRVIEFDGRNIKEKHVKKILNRVFFPHRFSDEIKHNRRVVIRRYSLETLNNNIREIIYRLYLQIHSDGAVNEIVTSAFSEYRKIFDQNDENLDEILHCKNRTYIAGFGRLEFMLRIKSLIDPSFFRIEEQQLRGYIFWFAQELIKKDPEFDLISDEKKVTFYNAVDDMFGYQEGTEIIRHDHSLAYRHRNRIHYPYREYTQQELTGLVNLIYQELIQPVVFTRVEEGQHFFTDWNLALFQLTGSNHLAIDNRIRLIGKICENVPVAYFPGEFLIQELDVFALQSVRSRLGLKIEEPLTRSILAEHKDEIAGIYIFTQEKNPGRQLNMEETIAYIVDGNNEELNLIYEFDILTIVPTDQLSVGIHFHQLGPSATSILKKIRDEKGFLITTRRDAAIMTDIVNIDRFHIGRVISETESNMMGIPLQSGYIQFVPAGVRTVLAYPAPVQTALEFDTALKSRKFRNLAETLTEKRLFDEIRLDAESNGLPLKLVLDRLDGMRMTTKHPEIGYEYISGLYSDGMPYNGVIAKIDLHPEGGTWDFRVMISEKKPAPVAHLVKAFEKENGLDIRIAWNGGYILNPELVGKLGLPESYIGTPLGLIAEGGKVISPPLYNKAGMVLHRDGHVDILRINCSGGIILTFGDRQFNIPAEFHNPAQAGGPVCYYDLIGDINKIEGLGRVIIRLAGNRITEIISTKDGDIVEIMPVGLTLSFRRDVIPEGLEIGDEVGFVLPGLEDLYQAVGAGPLLLEDGRIAIDMEEEGWTRQASIITQAARLDFTDLRGPKIAAGLNDSGHLYLLAINGRIRESVGATHHDMATILQRQGVVKAMGFDPGGSSTLVIDGQVKNIAPYNKAYETNTFALSPEPRAVSNAIIGYIRNV